MRVAMPSGSMGWLMVAILAPFLGHALAQAPAPPPAQRPGTEAYSYDPHGRRDPFVSMVTRGSDTRGTTVRGEGLAGLTVSEISVRGIMQSHDGYMALVQGPDSKTYVVHANDKLVDGVVKTITAQALVILQDVNDPLSLVKQREVRKPLRPTDEGK